jgi:hypothetical protein
LALSLIASSTFVLGDEPKTEAPASFAIGENDAMTLVPAKAWKKKTPRTKIVEHEFEVPVVEGDEIPGRLTVMGSGGSIDENVNRWLGQFTDAAGKGLTRDKAKVEKLSIGGLTVHYVDLSGTYKDAPGGPFAGGATTLRENYRMLGAIIENKTAGNYFLKLYGPKATIEANEKPFQDFVNSLKAK